ncbi:MAG: NTP transferase domain-containing protein, partial [Enterocloster sp.]
MRTGAVIAAAGMSEQPEDCRPLMKMGSITVIQRLISTLRQAGVDPIVVVTGDHAEMLEHHIGKQGVICLRNPEFAESEMFDSVRLGLSYIQDSCDQTLFSPADTPFFTVDTVNRLINSGKELAVPVCGGKSGHPILISCQLFSRIIAYQGTGGLREALRDCGCPLCPVEVGDRGALYETDAAGDYEDLLKYHNHQLLRPEIKLALARETVFLDQTSARLLNLIRQTESVRTACVMMNLSYSKGWNILNLMEEQLGFSVLVRHPGGMNGGHSALSPEGERLLQNFEMFQREMNEAAKKAFERIFEVQGEKE